MPPVHSKDIESITLPSQSSSARTDNIQLDLQRVINLTEQQSLDYLIAASQTKQARGYFVSSFAPLLPSIFPQFSAQKSKFITQSKKSKEYVSNPSGR